MPTTSFLITLPTQRECITGTGGPERPRCACERVRSFPRARSHLIRVGLHVLERLEDAEGLVNRAAEPKVVDGGVLDHSLLVDDEQPAESDALVVQHLVRGAAGGGGRETGRISCKGKD